jgi:N-acetylmuramoyl-L-alanine amidase
MARSTPHRPHSGFSYGLRAVASLFCAAGAVFCLRQAVSVEWANVAASGWTEITETRPLILIDAGHGGVDGGTKSAPLTEKEIAQDLPTRMARGLSGGGMLEKDLALDVALRLSRTLTARGHRVALTRENDETLRLEDRARMANEWGAALLVSLHFDNAGRPGAKASGVEVLYTHPKDLGPQKQLATTLGVAVDDPATEQASTRLGSCIHDALVQDLRLPGRGVRPQGLAVCRESACPAVLIEGGFLSSEEDVARLRRPEHRQAMAEAVASGIEKYLR